MKKIAFLSTLMIFAFGICFSQNADNNPEMGFKTGLNFTGFGFSEESSKYSIGTIVRPTIGIYGNLPISTHLSIQLEGAYSGLGHKLTNSVTGEKIQRLDYVSIPVLFKYHSGERFKLLLGAEWDILVSSTQKYHAVDNEFKSNENVFNGDDFAVIGGFEYNLGGCWSFQTRYVYGLTEIRKFEPVGSNRSLQTTFMYRLGKR